MPNQNQNAIQEKKVWLKVTKTGLLFEETESIAERKDPRLFVKATEEEIKIWKEGKFWKRAEPKPVETTTSQGGEDFKKIIKEMQAEIEKLKSVNKEPESKKKQ